VILSGHTRLKALKKLKYKETEVLQITGLTDEQKRKYRILANKTGERAEWDLNKLEIELDGLDFEGYDFDFDGIEIENNEPAEVVEDDYNEEPPAEPKAKLGDIYQLGSHRLICGDSTDPAVIDRLMDGVKADMLFTSPPYSDMREYNGGKDLSVSNISKFIGAYKPYTDYQCVNLGIQRKNHEIVQYWDEYIAKARECGYKLLAWNVWDKMECGSIGQQSAFFPIRHEWIFVFGTEFYEINLTQQKKSQSITAKGSPKGTNTRRQADGSLRRSSRGDRSHPLKQMESVLQLTPVKVHDIDHPAPFPVQLPAEYIKAMTDEGGTVIEPFGGSGSTLIACEQLNRKCYMVELDPKYVSVILQRYINFKGSDADVFLIKDGKKIPYTEIAGH
jgi:DNA modification methylase